MNEHKWPLSGDHRGGKRIPFVTPPHPDSELPFMERMVISVHLSGAGTRQILLQLDSGSDGPILYPPTKEKGGVLPGPATPREGNSTEAQKAFAVLPPQELRIGNRTMSHIPFVTPVRVEKDVPIRDEDGLLPTLLFQRVFTSGEGLCVVLNHAEAKSIVCGARSVGRFSGWRDLACRKRDTS